MPNNFQYNALSFVTSKFERRKRNMGMIEFDDKSIPGLFVGSVLQAAVAGYSLGGRSVGIAETNHLNGVIKEAAGPDALDDLEITFNDYNEAAVGATSLFPVRRFIEQWFNIIYNESLGTQQAPAAYKTRATLLLLDGNQRVDFAYELIGLFPKKRPDIGVDHTSRDAVQFTIPFSVDFVRVDDTKVHLPM